MSLESSLRSNQEPSALSQSWWCLHFYLMAHTVNNLPAMQEIQVRSLGWEDPLEKEGETHSSVLAWKVV